MCGRLAIGQPLKVYPAGRGAYNIVENLRQAYRKVSTNPKFGDVVCLLIFFLHWHCTVNPHCYKVICFA